MDKIDGKLILLIGPPASGKSTYALNTFLGSEIWSADKMRSVLTGDDNNQEISYKAFQILDDIVRTRLGYKLHTVVDNTNTRRADRLKYLGMAKEAGVKALAIIFNTPYEECVNRDASRSRTVGPEVIKKFHDRMSNVVSMVKEEGFDRVFVVDNDGIKEV